MNKNFVLNRYCEIAVAYAVKYVQNILRNFKKPIRDLGILIKKLITAFYDYIWLITYQNKNNEILQSDSSALKKNQNISTCYNGQKMPKSCFDGIGSR